MKYRMTDEEYEKLLNASKVVPYLVVGRVAPESPYDKAMRVWDEICARVKCDRNTVKPCGGDDKEFEAEPVEGK